MNSIRSVKSGIAKYDKAIGQAESKMKSLGDSLPDLASAMREEKFQRVLPVKGKDGYTPAERRYYSALKKYQKAEDKRRSLLDSRTKLNKRLSELQPEKPHKEATHREITSSTYERYKKRKAKELADWFGNGLTSHWSK